MIKALFIILIALASVGIASAQVKSIYTKLDDKHCTRLKADRKNGELDSYRCRRVGDYWLKLIFGEDSNIAELVTRSGKEFSTDVGFAGRRFVGNTAEWRLKNGRPIGLILRYDLMNPENGKMDRSLLVVSKISRSKSCVIDAMAGSKNQNAKARKVADGSAARPCKPDNWFPENVGESEKDIYHTAKGIGAYYRVLIRFLA